MKWMVSLDMRMDDLKYYIAVCELRNFSEAAEKCYVTQPAITQAIKRLETFFGVPILERDRTLNSIRMTPAGYTLLHHAKNLTAEHELAILNMNSYLDRKVSVGIPPIIATYYFPAIMRGLINHKYNDLFAIEEVDGSLQLLETLRAHQVDLAILGSDQPGIQHPEIKTYPMFLDEFVICCSVDHPLAKAEKIDFADLKNEKFISLNEHNVQHKVLLNMAKKYGFEELDYLAFNEFQTIKSFISSGIGIGLLIKKSIGDRSDIVTIPLTEKVPFYIMAAYAGDIKLNRRVQVLFDKIIEFSDILAPLP